ncbi:MAG TPA: HAMP domain-containing sensor histidine kinase [Acidimicrobiales bacterium]|nr:HAMP domain-containing sensor histidine kinase [Acidimicrobiales bacterium]
MRSRRARLTGSVRVRTTLAATLIVAITLGVGSAILIYRFRASLDNNRRSAAVARAADIAALADTGRLPSTLGLPNQDATYAQVIDSSGTVLAQSPNIAGHPALAPPAATGSKTTFRRVAHSPVEEDGTEMLVVLPAGTPARPLTVLTGYSLVGNDFAVHDIKLGLFIGLPLLLLVVAGTTWVIVGRALRPIEAIRSEASEITSLGLHRRLSEPPSGDEIARLAATMNGMLDRLEASHDKQRTFVADASHELRSPLASLRAQLEIGLAGGASTDWESTVTGALAEEARIEAMVRDLLLLARLDQQPPDASRVLNDPVLNLAEIVRADLETRPERPGIALRCDAEEPAIVRMPKELARRVVANLVDNAQRHAATHVTVAVTADGDWTELVVQDDGPGLAPTDRERVFERFTRLDEARSSDHGGAGLGLAIVKDIVARHGGTVGFVDCPRGARVVVRLPLADGHAPARTPAVPQSSRSPAEALQRG